MGKQTKLQFTVEAYDLSARVDRGANDLRWKTYIVSAGEYIKIGRTRRTDARMAGLQSGCPLPIELIALYRGNIEKDLHELFYDMRHHGEWFLDCSEIRDFIASHPPGNSDYTTL